MTHYEARNGAFTLSTDPARLDMPAVTGFLARAYWANQRKPDVIERSIRHSLNFGVYDGARQVAYCRVVTDYATFAWVCDVFVDEAHRGQGIGVWMLDCVVQHPELQGLRRWLLATRDAHGLYEKFGFTPLAQPELWMERTDPLK